jgi:hypothetical protein
MNLVAIAATALLAALAWTGSAMAENLYTSTITHHMGFCHTHCDQGEVGSFTEAIPKGIELTRAWAKPVAGEAGCRLNPSSALIDKALHQVTVTYHVKATSDDCVVVLQGTKKY